MKQTIRTFINGKLNALSSTEALRQAECVQQQLLNSKTFTSAKSVSVYVSFHGEVSTNRIIDCCFAEGKNVFVPMIQGNKPMEMLQIHSKDDLESIKVFKSVEILQPTRPETRLEALDSNGLDLIILPGVCFDKDGCRLGRGKGKRYYDAYLKKARNKFPNIKTVGLAFTEQIVANGEIPMEEHDQKLDFVFYPSK